LATHSLSTHRRFVGLLLVCLLLVGVAANPAPTTVRPAQAATQLDIDAAVQAAVERMALDQLYNGAWGPLTQQLATTCTVLILLGEAAHDAGYSSAFDPLFPQAASVAAGWNFVFSVSPSRQVYTQTIEVQNHTTSATGTLDDPDTNGNGYGVYFDTGYQVYTSGLCLAALAVSRAPDRPNDAGLDLDGDGVAETMGQIAQDTVDWLAFAQTDVGVAQGAWYYNERNNQEDQPYHGDNSNAGFAVLGLVHADAAGYTVPNWVKVMLDAWIDQIQDPVDGDADDGGSWYTVTLAWVNLYKTGHLLMQLRWVGERPGDVRMDAALGYIERHWRDPVANINDPGWGYDQSVASYLTTYALMRGLEYVGVKRIDVDGDGLADDWYNQEPPADPPLDLASALVDQQMDHGAWPGCLWAESNSTMCTAWAALTLQRAAPTPPGPALEPCIYLPLVQRS